MENNNTILSVEKPTIRFSKTSLILHGMNIFAQTETEEEVLLDVVTDEQYQIVVFNDHVNTFDHVIQSLMTICKHEWIQAEQCAWFVHTKGKYAVKSGQKSRLAPICETLCEKGLSAVLEFKD
jgi:ATP-dependent Clp protease adaptor protein ClpS